MVLILKLYKGGFIMRFGKQTVEIDLTDVKAGRFLENAERYIPYLLR